MERTMMTSREIFTRTLQHQPVERLPRDLWAVPYIGMFRRDEWNQILEKYPVDLAGAGGFHYGKSPYAKGEMGHIGSYVDEFGAVWEALEDGVAGEVKDPIIKTMKDLDNYRLPWEMLDDAFIDEKESLRAYKETDKFVTSGSYVRPFERLQFLLGSEQLFYYIADEDPIFLKLLERLHEFNVKDIKISASLAADGVRYMDDWGSQTALLISPAAWRKHFKPLYREYCDIIHKAGKFVFFHSDGHTREIIDDLVELKVDAFNTQLFCMDIEELGRKYTGKITFWGELDRQHILPFGSEEDVRASVRRLGKAFLAKQRSGLVAEMSWETVTPMRNIAAAFDEFGKL
jgi:hypothetical protein